MMGSLSVDDKDLSDLDDLIGKLKERASHLDYILNQKEIDAGPLMTKRAYLHQNSDGMSEEESALLEQSNPEIIKFLQYLKESTFKFFE